MSPETSASALQGGPGDLDAAYPARVIVDPAALEANARALATLTSARGLAVVKANGYGHGLEVAALAALRAGYTWLGVAQPSEALRLAGLLSQRGAEARILTWLVDTSTIGSVVAAGLDVALSDVDQVRCAAAAGAAIGRPARVHLTVDTGMTRLGAGPADVAALAQAAKHGVDAGQLRVVGLWSHLARADETSDEGVRATASQIEEFEAARSCLDEAGCPPEVTHLSASAGGLWHRAAHGDLVRWGIALYGYSPREGAKLPVSLTPALRVQARLGLVKRVEAGRGVSYGAMTRLSQARWVGIVPLGYANGIPRAASQQAWVSVGGVRAAQLGRICMDQFVVDLGPADSAPRAATGAQVDVLGGAGPDAWDWARWAGTIPYEILTGIGTGVPRIVAEPTALGKETNA